MKRLFLSLVLIAPALTVAEPVDVRLEPARVRDIGGVTKFDRDQFITVHESPRSNDLTAADRRHLENVLDARYGRDGGFLSSQAKRVAADPKNAAMPDPDDLKAEARKFRGKLKGRQGGDGKGMRGVILCTHPELMHAMPKNKHAPWGPRSFEGVAEYTAQFLKHFYTDNDRPRFLEVFNEPFVKARKIGTTIEALAEQHNVVAKRVRELNPDVMVGGYSAAWVEVEMNNFKHWESRQKLFMDIAGENMDFFSYHIYDGVNVEGNPRERTGSNSEALMDLVDTYSHLKFGVAKPIMITEYGMIPEGNMGTMPYSAKRSGNMLYALNGQHMTYMDHPDRLMRTIPFILGKGMWTYGFKGEAKPGEANPFLLWRKTAKGEFVATDLMMFYKFWKGIEGEWRVGTSSNPDVRVQCLADGNRLAVILGNLSKESKTVTLSGLEDLNPKSVALRTLVTIGERPEMLEQHLDEIPDTGELGPGMGAMLLIDLEQPVAPNSKVREHRVYATEYLKAIKANKPITFKFVDTPTGEGSAVLRFSPGRELGRAVLPTSVTCNGQALAIPTNWAGDDQAGRKNFFGMIEIPVPMRHLSPTNQVVITYPDSGGKVACAVLQVNRREPL